MDAKTSSTVIRVMAEEMERMEWRIDYEKSRADKAEKELAEVKAKLDQLTF